MAVTFEGVTNHGRTNAYNLDPLQLVPRFAAFTGRKERSEEAINRMVESLLLNGQEQAILVRKAHDGTPVPVSGHTRILAAARISERRMGMYSPENAFLVRAEYRQMNETEALFHTFAENDEDSRTPLNDVDIAFFIRTVSETCGLTDAQIAAKLGKTPNWVSRHRKVLDLDAATQDALATGKVKMDAAVNTLHKLAPEKRAELIANSNGTGPGVAKAARDAGLSAPRTDADFKAWLRATAEKVPARGQAMLQAIIDFRAGKISDDELTEMFVNLVGGKK